MQQQQQQQHQQHNHHHIQYQQQNNNKKNKPNYETPSYVLNKFYFHDPTYGGSPYINPDKKVIKLNNLFDKNSKRDKSFSYLQSCNHRLLTISPNNEKDSNKAICSLL